MKLIKTDTKWKKENGGRFSGKKPSISSGLTKWNKGEKWVQVVPYLTRGKIVSCGYRNNNSKKLGKACRPIKRINKSTPTTINELLKKYSKKRIVGIGKI